MIKNFISLSMESDRKNTAIFKNIIFFCICCVANIHSSEVLAAKYYVSPSGDNNYQGTLTSPFKTITYGVSKLKAGDILYVRTGTYVERVTIYLKVGTASDPIIIMAYPGEHPVIDGKGGIPGGENGVYMVNILNSPYVTFDGFEIKDVNTLGNYTVGGGIMGASDHLTIQNCKIHNIWASGVQMYGSHAIVQDCEIYDISMGAEQGSVVWMEHNNSAGNGGGIAVRGERDHWPNGPGAVVDSGIIRRNIVHDVWGEAISTFLSTHTIIEDNVVWNGWNFCIYLADTWGSVVQRNLVYYTADYTDPTLIGGSGVGIACWSLWANYDATIPWQSDNTIINNIAFNCYRNFRFIKLIRTTVAHNTFVNSLYEANVMLGTDNNLASENSYFENNIIVQNADNSIPIAYVGNPVGITINHNAWSRLPSSEASGIGDYIGDLKLAKSVNIEAGKLTGEYFKLLENSPAINKGAVIKVLSEDFFANLRDSLPDLVRMNIKMKLQLKLRLYVSGTGATSISTDGGTLQLSAELLPSSATNKTVTWSITNDTGQASINSSGLVTAISNGTVIARATANDGSSVSGSLTITISNQIIPVTNISVTGSNGATTITSDGGSLQLIANVLPANATNKNVIWSVGNVTGQATIDASGLLTAVSNGTVNVIATTTNNSEVYGSLIITVLNQQINNNAPIFENQQFVIKQLEFSGNYVGNLIAYDSDPNQQLTYTLISGNQSGLFKLDAKTGILTTTKSDLFNFDLTEYNLVVQVTDNGITPKKCHRFG